MRACLALLLALALCQRAAALELSLPKDASAKPGRLLKIAAATDAKSLKWVTSDDVDLIESDSGKWVVFLAPAPGKYRVHVVAADDKGNLAYACCVVTVEGPPAPVPPPNPPPSPTDPLYLSLKAAWDKEPPATRGPPRDRLATIYEAAVSYVTSPVDRTQGDLWKRVQAAVARDVGDVKAVLPAVRQAVAAYLAAALNRSPSGPIDPASAAAFANVAKTLRALP